MTYKPRPDQAELLDRAWEMIEGVPYSVTARWLFYRLLQEGCFTSKNDYKGKFLPLLAKARKNFYKGWTPDTLADDTRKAITRGIGWPTQEDFLEAIGRSKCVLDKWQKQENYCEIWFEAKAMRGQFEHYTNHITLRAFGGDCSIAFKWQIAQELREAFECYERPIVILYFGDLDPKGLQIPESAVKDIREWAQIPFQFIRGGLNPGDEHNFNIPENPEKPRTYQWEALADDDARFLISKWTNQFVSQGAFSEVEVMEKEVTQNFQYAWKEFLNERYEQ